MASSECGVRRRWVAARALAALAALALTVGASRASARTAPAAGVVPAARDSTQLNDFVSYDASRKTVSVLLIAAANAALGGFNFNGGFSGNQTLTVPLGWNVIFHFENHDAIPHSAIVIRDTTPIPVAPDQPAFPRAFTLDLVGGLPAQTGHDTMEFVASTAGSYLIACGVPGHARSGMYIRFVVSSTAPIPADTGTIAAAP